MSAWLWAATVLTGGLLACLWVCLRGSRWDAVAAVQLTGSVVTVVLILLSQGFERPSYFWVPLAFAPLTAIGSLAFVRVLERWL